MRDLVFKNLTSDDRKKRIICSTEVADAQGIHSVISRHFVCLVREVRDPEKKESLPYLYIWKERNNNAQREKFFCKIKGCLYAVSKGKIFFILYLHSLKINLTPIANQAL